MSASRAFLATFSDKALVASDRFEWDSAKYRLLRYALAEAYYANTVYSEIETFARRLKTDHKLYKHIRSIYSPVQRLTEFYVARVYGGGLDFELLEGGAVPILMASDPLKRAIRQTWLWSNWRAAKSVYVRTGALKGDVFLWVADEPNKQKVRIEVLDPAKVKEWEEDAVGNVVYACIEYSVEERLANGQMQQYVKRMDVDKERFATFKDGKPFGYASDGDGNPLPEWANEYGFVPLVLTKHRDMGLQSGGCAFTGMTPKIDEINDAASILNDAIRKAVNVVYYGAGISQSSQVTTGGDGTKNQGEGLRDETPILYGPRDSSLQALTPQLDITAAGANIDRLLMELERELPELSLHRLRESGNVTAPGVRAAYGDAIDRAKEAQGNYDDGYIRAQKMAVSIGGMRGYDGFQGFSLDSYDKGDLEFFVKERPVVGDSLGKNERLQGFVSAGSAPLAIQRLILEELDVDKARIDEIVAEQEAAQEQQARAAARGFAENVFGANDDDEEADARPGTRRDAIEGGTDEPANDADERERQNATR